MTGTAPAPAASETAAATGLPPADQTRVQRHLNLLATLWMANAVLRMARVGSLLVAGRVLPFFVGWGLERPFPHFPFDLVGYGLYALAVWTAVLGVAHAIFAIGLWQRQLWARMLGVVLAFLALIRIPFGTALGIYTLWVLLPDHSRAEYERLCRSYRHRSHASA